MRKKAFKVIPVVLFVFLVLKLAIYYLTINSLAYQAIEEFIGKSKVFSNSIGEYQGISFWSVSSSTIEPSNFEGKAFFKLKVKGTKERFNCDFLVLKNTETNYKWKVVKFMIDDIANKDVIYKLDGSFEEIDEGKLRNLDSIN